MEKGPGLAALVGHGWRLASLAGLRLGALYSRFDPRPWAGPTLATLVRNRPRSEDLFAKRSSVSGKRPSLAALVGHRRGGWPI